MNATITNQFRIEEDSLGDVRVPSDRLWGAQTQRSHLNFLIGVERFRWDRPVIRALGILKKCAALAKTVRARANCCRGPGATTSRMRATQILGY